jgi:hypothetical protein
LVCHLRNNSSETILTATADHADRGITTGQIGLFMDEAQRVLFEAGLPALRYINHLRNMTAGAWVSRVWDRVRVAGHEFLRKHLASGGAVMLMVPSLNVPGVSIGSWSQATKFLIHRSGVSTARIQKSRAWATQS